MVRPDTSGQICGRTKERRTVWTEVHLLSCSAGVLAYEGAALLANVGMFFCLHQRVGVWLKALFHAAWTHSVWLLTCYSVAAGANECLNVISSLFFVLALVPEQDRAGLSHNQSGLLNGALAGVDSDEQNVKKHLRKWLCTFILLG